MFWKYGVVILLNTFLGPGVGQLVLKQFKKGFIILAICIVILFIMSGVILSSADLSVVMTKDFSAMRSLAADLIEQNSGRLKIFNYSLMILWAYSYADIIMSVIAERRKNETEK
jgi:hypothetical protein